MALCYTILNINLLVEQGRYADATIACNGDFFKAHKLVLSSCSDYFEEIFNHTDCKHPVIVLKDVRRQELQLVLDYMYCGEVDVLQDAVENFLDVAKSLMVKGLPEKEVANMNEFVTNGSVVRNKTSVADQSNATSRKRLAENPGFLKAKRLKTENSRPVDEGETMANGSVSETSGSVNQKGRFFPQDNDDIVVTVKLVSLV